MSLITGRVAQRPPTGLLSTPHSCLQPIERLRVCLRRCAPGHLAPLRRKLFAMIDGREPARYYESLAAIVDSPEVRSELESRLDHSDPEIRRRSRWALNNAIRRADESAGAGP